MKRAPEGAAFTAPFTPPFAGHQQTQPHGGQQDQRHHARAMPVGILKISSSNILTR